MSARGESRDRGVWFLNAEKHNVAYEINRDNNVAIFSKFAFRCKESMRARKGLWENLKESSEAREAGGVERLSKEVCARVCKQALEDCGGDPRGKSTNATASMCAAFCCGTQVGDKVIMCDLASRKYCVGEVVGGLEAATLAELATRLPNVAARMPGAWREAYARVVLPHAHVLYRRVRWIETRGDPREGKFSTGFNATYSRVRASTYIALATATAAATAAETPSRRRRRADAPSSTAAVPPQQDAAVAAETPSRRRRRADARSSAAAAPDDTPSPDTPPPRKRDRPTTRASRAATDDEAFDAADAAQTLGECTVCLDRTARVAMVPCGHVVLCAQCCRALREKGGLEKCCICRQEVENTVAIRL